MKIILFMAIALIAYGSPGFAQSAVADQSLQYQQERMVYLQWDQNKFTPKAGFLSLNPYYWLTWGLFHPDYHQTDRRPLSASGPQTGRLGLVAIMNSTDGQYKLQSDTIKNTALAEIVNHSGLVTDADPLWQWYYRKELKPVIDHSATEILSGLSPAVSAQLVTEGLYAWYKNELDMLAERINAAHSADMDRGSRILAYHRLLLEYRRLAGVWAIRTASAQKTMQMTAQGQKLKSHPAAVSQWTPQTDVRIAKTVLQHVQ